LAELLGGAALKGFEVMFELLELGLAGVGIEVSPASEVQEYVEGFD